MRRPPIDQLPVLRQAIALHDQGRLWEAEQFYRQMLTRDDRYFFALCRFGVLRIQQRQFEDAAVLLRRALKVDKDSADAHQYLAYALTALGRPQEAIRSYRKALALRPDFAEAHNNLGHALQMLGQIDAAIKHYQKALTIRTDYAEAHNNLGNALLLLDRSAEAIRHFESAIAIAPNYAEACWNLGAALRSVDRAEDAIGAYERAIAINPRYVEAYNGLGNTFRILGRYQEAAEQYEKALALDPKYPLARLNLGDVLLMLQRADEAFSEYDKVLTLAPDDTDALSKKAQALAILKRYGEAIPLYERALALNARHQDAFNGLTSTAMAACEWRLSRLLSEEVSARVAKGLFFPAFEFLACSDDPSLQLACASTYVSRKLPYIARKFHQGPRWLNDKIRIAYLSCGFHRHPTAYLSVELFEIHDRSRFEVFGFSTGPEDGSDIRARLVKAFDRFHDVRDKSDYEVAALMNDMRIDIAVDRSGYAATARTGILAHRPAPVQVNYIGFPGTLGADFFDYVIADGTVLPMDQQRYYLEKIVHLPDCYLSNDSKRVIAPETPSRQSVGLPDRGFVFCCFNHCYKITPPVFDVWMRLLDQVEGSVLWLLRDNTAAEDNLRREAAARSIDPRRLVFAERVALEQHLARHRLADLFLDTLPFNAHTTAGDALWAGLPVLTCQGRSLAGRVAASLLKAIGMPDLITDNLQDYEALAAKIASDRAQLDEIRARLQRNRLTYPLFDSHRYRRHIEAAYCQMWEIWQRGEAPHAFAVTSDIPEPLPQMRA